MNFSFNKKKYRLLILGLIFIITGYILMSGGGSDNPEIFSSEIFNFRRLTLSTILIITGLIIEFFAIMKKS